jgi:AAA domain
MTDPPSQGHRPLFAIQDTFIETAFERRFQGLVRHAWQARSWHVIAAVPGSGKSLGITDLLLHSSACKEATGTTQLPLLAIRAPKNAAREEALGMALSAALGMTPTMPWGHRRTWLVQQLARTQVECLIIDDAQDLTLAHLALLKELTDNLAAPPYRQHMGLCLVAAHSGHVMPFRETFARPETLWRQFRRRLDTERPFCIVLGHTTEEVRDILTTFEDLYHSQLPDLHLRCWAHSIGTWLTHQSLDPDATGRVTMDHLTRLVTSVLRRAYEQGASDVNAAVLNEVAELMVLRRDDIVSIDGLPPSVTLPVQEVG